MSDLIVFCTVSIHDSSPFFHSSSNGFPLKAKSSRVFIADYKIQINLNKIKISVY